MNGFHSTYCEALKYVFRNENLAKYCSILLYYYALGSDEDYQENPEGYGFDKLLEIDRLLSDFGLDEDVAISLSNRYVISLFFISFFAPYGKSDKEMKKIAEETISLLNNSPIMKFFDDVSCEPFSDKFKIRIEDKNKLKIKEDNLIKNYNEALKNNSLIVSKLEDEIEELNQRIEKSKKTWYRNKQLEEENKKLKLMLKNLGVNELSTVTIFTDDDLPVHGQSASSSESKAIPAADSKNSMMTDLLTPSKNNIDHTRSYAQTFRERGRFGSHPSHDDFGDESVP